LQLIFLNCVDVTYLNVVSSNEHVSNVSAAARWWAVTSRVRPSKPRPQRTT